MTTKSTRNALTLATIAISTVTACLDDSATPPEDVVATTDSKADGAGSSFLTASTVTVYDPSAPSANILFDAVVQQPANDPGFISPWPNRVTEFSLARDHRTHGFVAHNNLAGRDFASVQLADVVDVTLADATSSAYAVTQRRRFRALSPSSPYSSFIEVDEANHDINQVTLSASDLFAVTYVTPGRAVLQTCIDNAGNASWGRLFLIASPLGICGSGLSCRYWDDEQPLQSGESACRQTTDRTSPILACRAST